MLWPIRILITATGQKDRLSSGLYGYTYLGHNHAWLNETLDQTPEFKYRVDVHESVHTDDDYETGVISKGIVKTESRKDMIRRISKN